MTCSLAEPATGTEEEVDKEAELASTAALVLLPLLLPSTPAVGEEAAARAAVWVLWDEAVPAGSAGAAAEGATSVEIGPAGVAAAAGCVVAAEGATAAVPGAADAAAGPGTAAV